ncbi:uncharacterized protein [Argopecten irradians]|uniref:uncharacterized protein isoform X1 n=1 Tax=Argopecten irradians TaxID=31199 RepID=UPI003714B709
MAKNGRIILTKHSKIMTGPLVDVPEDVSAKATFIICPPSPVKTIKDVKEMPRRSLVTIRGQIVKDECMKEVKVGNDPTNIHTIRLCQDGEEIYISLWRDAAETKVNVGDYIEVTQCVTGEWNRAVVANTTRNTKVKLVEEVEMTVNVEGLSMEELEDHVNLIVSENTNIIVQLTCVWN